VPAKKKINNKRRRIIGCNTLILLKFWLYKNLLATIYLPKEYKVVYLFLGI
jgi:hypothetical protein